MVNITTPKYKKENAPIILSRNSYKYRKQKLQCQPESANFHCATCPWLYPLFGDPSRCTCALQLPSPAGHSNEYRYSRI